jgi:predicted phage terminase large subunit-like protein
LLEAARRSPAALAYLAANGHYQYPPHIQLIDEALQEVACRRIKRLIVTMPPRHGKSELISKTFPAWYLGRFPDHKIILTSYEADFAESWGAEARNMLAEYGPEVFGVQPNPKTRAGRRWNVDGHKGKMATAGAGGAITGKGAHLLIIDDPIKNDEEANSPTYREKVWNWYRATAYTRLESDPDGVVVVVMTRWNEDDLVGRLLALDASDDGGPKEDWVVLNLPALAEEDDLLGRQPGEALWPAKYPVERLERIKRTSGTYWWSALFQQRPAPLEGMRFKKSWFRYFSKETIGGIEYYVLHQPDGTVTRYEARACWRFQTVDPAATKNETSDYFVCSTFAVTPANDLLLLAVFREKAETTQHEAILRAQADRWKPGFQAVESAFIGLSIIQTCISKGLPIQELRAETDKLARSLPAQARYEVGAVYHDAAMPGLDDVESELVDFPNGKHDDIVDTISYAAIQIAGWGGEVEILTSGKKRESVHMP